MIALEITSMKLFMHQLLAADTFDPFLLEEATICTGNTFQIDGKINAAFYQVEAAGIARPADSDGTPYDFRPFQEVRSICFDLMKGKTPPTFFRFVLHLKPEKAKALLEGKQCDVDFSNIKALVLTIRYDGTKTLLTTATAFTTFLLSKEPDLIWDHALQQYLSKKEIPYEQV